MSYEKSLFDLKGRVAVVTGGLGLIGRKHCEALAQAGANVMVCDLNGSEAQVYAKSLPTDSFGFTLDITSEDSLSELKDFLFHNFKKLDILVNNAAINDMVENPTSDPEASKFENYPLDLFKKVMEVNVTGMFLTSKILGQLMVMQNKGSIINIASTYGIVGPNQSIYIKPDGTQAFFKSPAYPTAKGAVINFTRFLASYWGNKGIRVNTLSPGGVENGQEEFFIANYSKNTPLARMAKADDYKGALIFLASDASSYMTGANLVVDGGWTAW